MESDTGLGMDLSPTIEHVEELTFCPCHVTGDATVVWNCCGCNWQFAGSLGSLSPLLPADTLELEGGKRRRSLWSVVRLRWTAFLGPLSTDAGNDK